MEQNIFTMEELISHSVLVNYGMIAEYPFSGSQRELIVSNFIHEYPHCYSLSNNTIAFVSGDKFYVTPYTSKIVKSLDEKGFDKAEFEVPFSDGSWPKHAKAEWESLHKIAFEYMKTVFCNDCLKFSDAHHIGAINQETLNDCVKIPEKGVFVKQCNGESRYFPIVTGCKFNTNVIENIGTYNVQYDTFVVFVYRDGCTYVSKDYRVVYELVGARFKRNYNLFVPFAEDETIMDYELREKWESLKKFKCPI